MIHPVGVALALLMLLAVSWPVAGQVALVRDLDALHRNQHPATLVQSLEAWPRGLLVVVLGASVSVFGLVYGEVLVAQRARHGAGESTSPA